MSFTSNLFESDIEETARLAAAPKGSTHERASRLTVTNPYVSRGQILELPQLHTIEEDPAQRRIVVVLLEQRDHTTKREDGKRLRDASWSAMVLASTDPSYPAGGYDIVVEEARLRRASVIEPASVLGTK